MCFGLLSKGELGCVLAFSLPSELCSVLLGNHSSHSWGYVVGSYHLQPVNTEGHEATHMMCVEVEGAFSFVIVFKF